jgi:protein-S-isoprenylcysteine O-methyltransferase Ste14
MDDASYVRLAVPVLWVSWLVYWWLSARDVKPTTWREPLRDQLKHRVPLILAAVLMAAPGWLPRGLSRRILPAGGPVPVAGAAMVAAGLGFAIWARRHLGRNWSADVVVKEGHALVRSGPYRYVRHPIYTGLLLAFLGSGVTLGEFRILLAIPLALLSFAVKSRAEEGRMLDAFPEYARYRQETAALIPFVY